MTGLEQVESGLTQREVKALRSEYTAVVRTFALNQLWKGTHISVVITEVKHRLKNFK